MTFVYGQHSYEWKVPFYAETGRKYIITLLRVWYSLNGNNCSTELPVSLVEKNSVIVATYPNMTREIFTGVHEMAKHFDSTITDYVSTDKEEGN